jgi:DNA-directed RNA polymerase subunit RPC12/RpoP
MMEDATALDLYSYGRALDRTAAPARREPSPAYVCIGCGASVASTDPDLVCHLGWRLLPRTGDEDERPVVCPRCARRRLSLLR